MNLPEEKLSKLPAWAREYIENIENQRDAAIKALNKFVDEQTPSAFYFDDSIRTGEEGKGRVFKRRYVPGRHLCAEHDHVYLDIILREGEISLSWSTKEFASSGDIAFIPTGYQQAKLVAKENMR